MSNHCRCEAASPSPLSFPPTPLSRSACRFPFFSSLLAPLSSLFILLLLPKCPACLAAYVTLATGIGITFSTASHLRTAALTLGTISLAFLATKAFNRIVRTILARS